MRTMIFAAGEGMRLRPLTNTIPKALISVGGISMLERSIRKLKEAGVNEIIINVHHLAEKIVDFIIANKNFGIKIEISYEEKLLDTGGGLKKASWFFNDNKPFFLYNVDILTDLKLNEMLVYHKLKNADITLAVMNRESSRKFLFNDDMALVGWENVSSEELVITRECDKALKLGFCGISIISPNVLKEFPDKEIFSMRDFYLELSAKGYNIYGMPIDGSMWFDIGNHKSLEIARSYFT